MNSYQSGEKVRPAASSKEEAQQRADQIILFKHELTEMERDGILHLTDEQRKAISAYHGETLKQLTAHFDIDMSQATRQMSMGMRIVSFLGAIALSAAVFFFFYRYWGNLSVAQQVAILVAAPIAALAGVEFAARREKTLYFASLVSLVAFTAFVLDLTMLGQIFTITPTQNAFLAWGALSLALAYTYRLRLVLVAGLISMLGYLTATMGAWSGIYWLSFGERPENFLAAGILIFAAAFIPLHRKYEFAPLYRMFGLLVVMIAVLVLSHWGMGSYLMIQGKHVEYLYQAAGFTLSGLVIWLGIRAHWPGITNLGCVFFVIFLYTKFYDWWWEWMPKYLFFLLLGLIALLILFLLKRLRKLVREVTP
jgi:uncharacterized membrane protein